METQMDPNYDPPSASLTPPRSAVTDEGIKRIDIAEFRRLGYVQEINRRLLHQCGLALEVVVNDDGTETLGGVWDYRDDPEGIYFAGEGPDAEKAQTVDAEIARHADARQIQLGYVVQPPDAPR
jgi:hypothetical protein